MNEYRVTTFAQLGAPQTWGVSAQYWEYDNEFAAFYVDPEPGSKQVRDCVFAVPLEMNPVIERTAP